MTETLASKFFNGVDLGAYGLVTPSVSGIHDSADEEVSRGWVAGRSYPTDVALRRSLVPVKLKCVVAEESHDLLLAKLATLRRLMSPALGFCELRIDRPNQRTFARSKGFGISSDRLPYLDCVAEWDWKLERYGYWEDASAQSIDITGATGTINNTGDLVAYPVYTCTATDTLAGGLTFTVGGQAFSYTGALASTDVLTVYTDLPDVTKAPSGANPARDFGNTASSAAFPALAVGANAVTAKTANFTLGVSWRRRWE